MDGQVFDVYVWVVCDFGFGAGGILGAFFFFRWAFLGGLKLRVCFVGTFQHHRHFGFWYLHGYHHPSSSTSLWNTVLLTHYDTRHIIYTFVVFIVLLFLSSGVDGFEVRLYAR